MSVQSKRVVALLSERWWTQRALGAALGVKPSLLRWHILQIAKRRPVFARHVTEPPFPAGPRPREYRVYPQAFQVAQK